MTLLKPFMLFGVLFALFPLLIHLLNRSRYNVEPFGGMMFLYEAMRIRAGRLRFRQFVLLLVRCLFFCLMAFALARPAQRVREMPGGRSPRTHIFILDTSMSMQAGNDATMVFEDLRKTTLDLVQALVRKGDNVQLLTAGGKVEPLFAKAIFDKKRVLERIRELKPGYATANMPFALQQAFWSLNRSLLPGHRVYVITDNQKDGWRTGDKSLWTRLGTIANTLPVDPAVYVVRERHEDWQDNVAITGLKSEMPMIDIWRSAVFSAEISWEGVATRTTQVQFLVDGKLVSERSVQLTSGATMVQFRHRFSNSGLHNVTVSIEDDVLNVDNRRDMVFKVVGSLPILILEGHSAGGLWSSDAGFFVMALTAGNSSEGTRFFSVDRMAQTEMERLDVSALRDYKAVVLADVSTFSEYFVFALERYAEQGGGILFAAGDSASAQEYEPLFNAGRGLLPAKLIRKRSRSLRDLEPVVLEQMLQNYAFGFKKDRFVSLFANARMNRYWECKLSEVSQPLAWVGNEVFLSMRQIGEGRSLLWASSLNAEWNDLPFFQDYVPLVQNLVLTLIAASQQDLNYGPGEKVSWRTHTMPIISDTDTEGESLASQAGDSLGGEMQQCRLVLPDQSRKKFTIRNGRQRGSVVFDETELPGIYRFRCDNRQSGMFAVQPPDVESTSELMAVAELQRFQAPFQLRVYESASELKAGLAALDSGREWWQTVMLAAVFILLAESFMSWRFSK